MKGSTAHATTEGENLMLRLNEMRAEHEQRVVAHLSSDQLRDLLDYLEAHDKLAHSHLLPDTLVFIRAKLTI